MNRPTVAVIGAGNGRHKFGNKSVRAHLAQGYEVYPVNPREKVVEGLTCYAVIEDIPLERLDRVTVYVRPTILIDLLAGIASKQPGEFWMNPGTESEAVLLRAEQLGLNPITACSIVDLGTTPSEYPDA